MSKRVFAVLIAIGVSVGANSLTVVDVGGSNYKIAEEDIARLMKEYVANNEDKIKTKLAKAKEKLKEDVANYKPSNMTKKIFPATKNRTHYPETIYTVKEDIMDNHGGILYKKGYKFNPLHYITLRDKYVFFDYTNKEQVEWIKANRLDKDITVRLIITDGRVFDAIKFFDREVFYANDPLLEKFNVWASPSVVVQEGDRIKVEEFYVSKGKDNDSQKISTLGKGN